MPESDKYIPRRCKDIKEEMELTLVQTKEKSGRELHVSEGGILSAYKIILAEGEREMSPIYTIVVNDEEKKRTKDTTLRDTRKNMRLEEKEPLITCGE